MLLEKKQDKNVLTTFNFNLFIDDAYKFVSSVTGNKKINLE